MSIFEFLAELAVDYVKSSSSDNKVINALQDTIENAENAAYDMEEKKEQIEGKIEQHKEIYKDKTDKEIIDSMKSGKLKGYDAYAAKEVYLDRHPEKRG